MERNPRLLLEQIADSSTISKPLIPVLKENSFALSYDSPEKSKCNFLKGISDWTIEEIPDSFGLYVKREHTHLPYNSDFYIGNVKVLVSKLSDKYYITIYSLPEITQQCSLNQKIHIGNSYDENDLVIDNKYVSKKHAAIKIGKDSFELTENPINFATNCTWVKQIPLKINENTELIKIGVHKFFRVSLAKLHDVSKSGNLDITGTTTDINTGSTQIIEQTQITNTIGNNTKLLNSIPTNHAEITTDTFNEWKYEYEGDKTPKWN